MGLVVRRLEVAKRVELLVVVAVTVTVLSVPLVGRLGLPVRRWLVRRGSQVEVVRLLVVAIGLVWLLLRWLGLPMIVAEVLLEGLLVLLPVWLCGCLSRLLLRGRLLLRRLLRLFAGLFGGSHGLELLVFRLWLLRSVLLLTRTSLLFHRLIVLIALRLVLLLSGRLGVLRLRLLLLWRTGLGRWINLPSSFFSRFLLLIFVIFLRLLWFFGLGRFLSLRGGLSIRYGV